MRFVNVGRDEVDGQFEFDVQLCLGDVQLELVRVEFYADPLPGEVLPEVIELAHAGQISTGRSTLHAFVIPTDEELMIARDTYGVVTDRPRQLHDAPWGRLTEADTE